VYFAIREVKLKIGDEDATRLSAEPNVLTRPWFDEAECGGPAPSDALRLADLDAVYVRYFYYYEQDVGTGPHTHDVEATDMKIMFRTKTAGTERKPGASSTYQVARGYEALLATVAGAAHGISWYVNTLSVTSDEARTVGSNDTLLPVTILVEEGKHASAPDRNGDGVFTPGYDVNVQPADAWGVRDTMRTKWIGGAAYRRDMLKQRTEAGKIYPERLDSAPVVISESVRCPEAGGPRPTRDRLECLYFRRLATRDGVGVRRTRPEATEIDDWIRDRIQDVERYELRWAGQDTTAALCTSGEVPGALVFEGPDSGTKDDDDDRLRRSLNNAAFCRPTRITGQRNWLVRGTKYYFRNVFTGAYGIGLAGEGSRVSASFRWDRTAQVTFMLPGAFRMGGGAWLVPKFDVALTGDARSYPAGDQRSVAETFVDNLSECFGASSARGLRPPPEAPDDPVDTTPESLCSVGGVYTPSASRFVDWYVFAGGERGWTPADGSLRWAFVQELGVKFRFRPHWLPFFAGTRIGLRTEAFDDFTNSRMIVEFGAGSW
jgi:hypothetical protein